MKNVWIIDDDRSIRWVLEKALTREAMEHRSFENAMDAWRALETEQPSVIVSDVRMPGESGLTLLKKIKAAYPHIPVIIMTAYSDLDTAVQAFQGGAFEYLPKPFDVEQALALIRRAAQGTEVVRSTDDSPAVGEREMLVVVHGGDERTQKATGRRDEPAAALGFSAVDQTKIATVVSELARNIVCYAASGTIELKELRDAAGTVVGIEVRAQDQGPGIAGLDEILAGRYRSKTGMGLGLLGAKRLMGDLQVDTAPGRGTTVAARRYLAAARGAA